MYSNIDFENFFICYISEAVTSKKSIQSFCLRNKVPYNLFEKWYKDTRHKLVPVMVNGQPDFGSSEHVDPKPQDFRAASNQETVRIMSGLSV